ncbi:Aste57867_19877 [Aphanomyces stellatus]|uniref:Aste57867_19877 protein n=1 Tax=Aphanomyces stellatus TaxID=120398 RepID=A0A485LE77_9STRA|nr:hypothetical protein As57867_019811 [Aphanomyces stellatus]VFT96575.1 Aste57867_19877 [Aphanomyces stellatus]
MTQTAASDVLRLPNLVLIICDYQVGLSEDLLPLKILLLTGYVPPSSVDKTLGSWLSQHKMSRLNRLFRHVPDATKAHTRVMQHAIKQHRLELLQWMAQEYPDAIGKCLTLLEDAAAIGNVAGMAYLHEIGYYPLGHIRIATVCAIQQGHLNILHFMHDTYTLQEWFRDTMAKSVTHNRILTWLFKTLPPATHASVEYWALVGATKRNQQIMARWLIGRMQPTPNRRAIAQVWLNFKRPAHLVPFVDPIDATQCVLASAPPKHRLERLQILFAALPSVQAEGDVRQEVVQLTLWHAIENLDAKVLRWLCNTQSIRRADVVDATCNHPRGPTALDQAKAARNVDMILFLHGHGVQSDESDVESTDEILFRGVGCAALALVLVAKLKLERSSATCFQVYERESPDRSDYVISVVRWIEWLVAKQEGGRVAVMGQLLCRLATTHPPPKIFPVLYSVWLSEEVNDAKRLEINTALLNEGSAKIVDCLGKSVDAVNLLQIAMVNNSLGVVRRLSKSTTCGMSTEEKLGVAR